MGQAELRVGFAASASKVERERLRLWEVLPTFRCPIVGACLYPREQRRLLGRAGPPSAGLTPFEMHEVLVEAAREESPLSKLVDQLLEQKYREVAPFLWVLVEQELLARWRRTLEEGLCPAHLWVIASRPDLSTRARIRAFGLFHMKMYASLGELQHAHRLLAEERQRNDRQESLLRELRAGARIRIQPDEPSSGNDTTQSQSRLRAKRSHRAAEIRISRGEERVETDASAPSRADEKPVSKLPPGIHAGGGPTQSLPDDDRKASAADTCPVGSLCGKRVLIVGGLDRMESSYRTLIESHGGVYERHSGCVRGGRRRLAVSLKRADLVICLADCNSHAACIAVKGLGKRLGRPVKMLGSSSLSSVSEALQEPVGLSGPVGRG